MVRELTVGESRAALSPEAVYDLTRVGHRVMVESEVGEYSDMPDAAYKKAGARICEEAAKVYADSELLVKVYGPVEREYDYLREDLILLSFLSLPVNQGLTRAVLGSGCVALAAEGVRDDRGRFPILAPMSEIAGRLTPQIGAHYLQRPNGGRGILLGGSTGVRPGRVVILGCGIVGSVAARVASGLGAEVVVIDRDLERLRRVEEARLGRVTTLAAGTLDIEEAVTKADLLIGAVFVGGSRTPALVNRETVKKMKNGSVIVDVDVDYGGCVETSRTTTLDAPTFVDESVVHYCVKNVPAAVPVTATRALSNAMLPFVREISGRGLIDSLNSDAGLRNGVVAAEGRIVSLPAGPGSGRRAPTALLRPAAPLGGPMNDPHEY